MFPTRTMEEVALILADRKFNEKCKELNKSIVDNLEKAFEGERISQARADRIVKKFCNNMLGVK